MKFSTKDLNWATASGLISEEQNSALIKALTDKYKHRPSFDLIHISYYTGALIVILAMVFFMAISWESFGHGGILLISLAYALGFSLFGWNLYRKPETRIPGGLLVTVAVCMTPLIVYSIERLTGVWPQSDPGVYEGFHNSIKGSWFLMEFWTVVAGIIALRFVRFPFILAPMSFVLWYMSMDMTPLLFGKQSYTWEEGLNVSLIFGVSMLLIGYLFDLKAKTKEDYSFWMYLFGLLSFWFSLALQHRSDEIGYFSFFAINVGLMLVSVILQRRLFIVFGGIGVVGYLGHLAWEVFRHLMLFPLVLTGIGIGIIFCALQYQKNQEAIRRSVRSALPSALTPFIPERALAE